jgi:hypothetical protein
VTIAGELVLVFVNLKLLLKFALDEIVTLSSVPSAVSKSSNGGAKGALTKLVTPDDSEMVCVTVCVVAAVEIVLGTLIMSLMVLRSEIGSSDSSRGRALVRAALWFRFARRGANAR